MPTLSSLQIPPPRNWQDFETLCCDLWRAIWNDPNTQKNGRQGQAQHGVDVCGRPNQGDAWAGVQCKGKDNYSNRNVTEKELRSEVESAKAFPHALSQLTIATTGPRDASIQNVSREITDQHRASKLFTVHVWSWDDIIETLERFPEVIAKHYPQYAQTAALREVITEFRTVAQDRDTTSRDPKKPIAVPQRIQDAINRGVDLLNNGHFKEAKIEFQQAVTLAEECKHPLAIVDAKEHLATVLIHFDHDAAVAEALLQSCLDILTTEDDEERRAEVLDRLASIHEQEGDVELSESLQRQSLAISQRLADKESYAGRLLNLGWTVGRRGRTDEALELNRRAYDLLIQVLHETKPGDSSRMDFVHTVLGNLFFQRAKIHQRRAEVSSAEQSLETALEWQRKVPPNHETAKLLYELAQLRFFKREWQEGADALLEAARLYQERQMLPEFAKCLQVIGRVHANMGNLEKATQFLSNAGAVAAQSGRSQAAAEVLMNLAHLAEGQRDVELARHLFENAVAASEDGEFQAECLMSLSHLVAKEGAEEERRRLCEAAAGRLKAALITTKPEMERAHRYFMLGWCLREAGHLEEALACVRQARERFETSNDARGVAMASFEAAGLLDHMGRKEEARAACNDVFKMVEGKPFPDIAAAVDLSLAQFAIQDTNWAEAERCLTHGIELCREHDLPLLPESLLLKDRLETMRRAGTEAAASITDLLDGLHWQLELCPANSEGYVRFWAFCHASKIGSALRATLGPNIAILTNDLTDFLNLSTLLKPYRDWSLLVPPERYPENVVETIPFDDRMLIPCDGVAMLAFKRPGTEKPTDLLEPSDTKEFLRKVHVGPEVGARISVSRLSTGGAIARYFFVSLGDTCDQFGGARMGAHGESLALPRAVHELLQQRDLKELEVNRLFFVYYNRGLADETERFWYDLAILHSFHCFPVYRETLPHSRNVRVVASCPVSLPVLTEESSQKHRRTLRSVRKVLSEVLVVNENNATSKLADLVIAAEDLTDEVHTESSVGLVVHVLGFEYEGTKRTHAAIVLK